jgi:hypothetical protein
MCSAKTCWYQIIHNLCILYEYHLNLLGSSWVAAQLAASQEWHQLREWVTVTFIQCGLEELFPNTNNRVLFCCRHNAESGECYTDCVSVCGHQHGYALPERPSAGKWRDCLSPHQTQSLHLPRSAQGLSAGTRELLRHRGTPQVRQGQSGRDTLTDGLWTQPPKTWHLLNIWVDDERCRADGCLARTIFIVLKYVTLVQ